MKIQLDPSDTSPSASMAAPTQENSASRLATAQSLLLAPYGLSETQLFGVLGDLARHGVDDADLYFQYTRNEAWSLEEGIVKTGSFSIDQGVGVRAMSGEKTAFAYSDALTMEAIADAARAVQGIQSMGGEQSANLKTGASTAANQTSTHAIQPRLSAARDLYADFDPIASLESAEKIELLGKVERLARARDPRITQVMASLAAEYDVVMVLRLDGTLAADVRPLVRLSISVIAEQGERRETGSSGGGGRLGFAYFDDVLVQDYVNKAVDQALINLESRPAPAGEMTVVLGSGWPGVMLHEAVGHGLEGDFNRKGASAFSGQIGKRVAAKGVTVLDDGTLQARRGSLNIDDEGHPTQRNVLIEDGVLRAYMQDSLNARLMGGAQTGNARRESYAHLPMPRMTNTYMLAGDKSPEEIVASIERGVYATNFGGGQVDITSGKFVFSASEAYWVENGKVQYPVKGATIIGNGPESLKKVTMIGNDLSLDSGVGVCGKEGQSVPVGVGQPTLRIEGLVVGGTA